MIKAYSTLHRYGKAKSIEVWENDELVGGFIWCRFRTYLLGESMFAKGAIQVKGGFIYFVEKYKNSIS